MQATHQRLQGKRLEAKQCFTQSCNYINRSVRPASSVVPSLAELKAIQRHVVRNLRAANSRKTSVAVKADAGAVYVAPKAKSLVMQVAGKEVMLQCTP